MLIWCLPCCNGDETVDSNHVDFSPLYSDWFSHTDKRNKDGIVHFIF